MASLIALNKANELRKKGWSFATKDRLESVGIFIPDDLIGNPILWDSIENKAYDIWEADKIQQERENS